MLQLQLIALYDYVCRCYDTYPALHFQRQSNNYRPEFTDQELLTIYLFGILKRRFTTRDMYDYIHQHWHDWFPKLPSYQAVNYRLNQLGWQFETLVNDLTLRLQDLPASAEWSLTDSLPIVLSRRPYSARVAKNWADKGYCPSKNLYYHGLKLHVLGFDRQGTFPLPERLELSPASVHDLTALKHTLPHLQERIIVGDKIYASAPLQADLRAQGVEMLTPIKLKKGQERLDAADSLFSTCVSGIRQPVECFFNWLIEKTHIQTASKVRSEKGLTLHCLGRLAAALYFLLFNP